MQGHCRRGAKPWSLIQLYNKISFFLNTDKLCIPTNYGTRHRAFLANKLIFVHVAILHLFMFNSFFLCCYHLVRFIHVKHFVSLGGKKVLLPQTWLENVRMYCYWYPVVSCLMLKHCLEQWFLAWQLFHYSHPLHLLTGKSPRKTIIDTWKETYC